MTPDKPGFFEEMKRRHVWRVAAAYAIAGWLVVQIATQVFPFFKIPDWGVRLVVLLIVIGFPIALAWAWIYELTPEGIRRTAPADSPEARPQHEASQIGRKLNTVIVTVLVLAVALMGWRLLVLQRTPTPAVAQAAGAASESRTATAASAAASTALAEVPPLPATSAAIPQKSVAVLPFTNESGDKDQQFFSDGLSEDLINALSQFAGLKVISRNSAFQFRGSKDSSAKIGQLLGVAHLLEGSVQRVGDTVRITATLVNASDGSTLWSEHYDKPYKDLFALQDAITSAVATALKAELLTAPGAVVQSDRPPGGNLDAYTAYQHGMAYDALATEAGYRKAIDAFSRAVRIDPNYAAAYARLPVVWVNLASTGMVPAAQASAKARTAADAALRIAPYSSSAHQARALVLLTADMDWRGAAAEARRALQLAPNDASAQFLLGGALATLGRLRQAVTLTRQALASDPRHAGRYRWLSTYLAAQGQLGDARQALDTAMALQPDSLYDHEQLAVVEILHGAAGAALVAARKEPPGIWHDIAMSLALQVGSDHAAADTALQELVSKWGDAAPYQVAEVYALRKDPDNTFKWLDRAWTSRDSGIGYLLYDPFILRYRDDPRFAAYCKKVGLPTTTDAVAMK